MSIRFMLDTDDLTKLTGHAEILATYADLVTDLTALQAKFPHSVVVLIDRGQGDPSGQASVFDVEPTLLTPEQAAKRYDEQHAKHVKYLTVYSDRNDVAAVDAAMGKRAFHRWIATLDGTAHIAGFSPLERPTAIQCFNAASLGYHADGSLVFNDTWHPTMNGVQIAAARDDFLRATQNITAALDDLHKLAAATGV